MTLGWTRSFARRALVALALGAAGTACGGGTATPDAGRVDSGEAPLPMLQPLVAYEQGPSEYEPTSLDYGCLGTLSEPAGADPVSTTFQLRDFQNGFEVDATEVWLFSNNTIADSCVPPFCQSVTTDRTGNAVATLPAGGWTAYRVLPKMGLSRMTTVFSVFQYNFPIPATSGAVTGNSVSGSTIDLLPATLGVSRTEGRALIAGRIRDCAGGSVENAVIRLYDPTGAPLLAGEGPNDPKFHYFSGRTTGNLPNLPQQHTHRDGLFLLIEVPVVGDGPFRIEAWGNLGGEPTRIGCEAARVFPDAVTIVNLNPIRADGPVECRP